MPTTVYIHHGGDLNIDHRIAHEACLTATRTVGEDYVKEVLAFETLSSTEWAFSSSFPCFRPNVFNRLKKEDVDKKCQAMACYRSELRDFPHPRSDKAIRVAAQKWGSVVGAEYAEAFELIRLVD